MCATSELSTLNQVYGIIAYKCDRLWRISLTLRWLNFLQALFSIITNNVTWYTAGTVFIIAILVEVFQLKAESLKDKSQTLKRLIETCNGLNCAPPMLSVSNMLAEYQTNTNDVDDRYLPGLKYRSTEPTGPRRMAENTEESSWWTHQLCKISYYRSLVLVIIFGSLVILALISLPALVQHDKGAHAISSIVSVLMLGIFNLGLIKRLHGLHELGQRSLKTTQNAAELINQPYINESDAILCLGEYQVARAQGPVISTAVWEKNRERLNAIFNSYKSRQQSSNNA